MNQLQNKFQSVKDQYNKKLGELQALTNRKSQCEIKINELINKEDLYQKTSLFLQSLSDNSRQEVLGRISSIVTDALQTVKDKNLIFNMDLQIERNVPTLGMSIKDNLTGVIYTDILKSFGGGLADLISLTLRICLLVKWTPSLQKILILDEVGKFISQKDQENLAIFIDRLSKSMGIQLIWITHSNVLGSVASKIFEVTKDNGISKVTEINNNG